MEGLRSFLARVSARIDEAVARPAFDPHQRALLAATVAPAFACADPLGHPLGLTYLIARAHGRDLDTQAEHVGAFCLLYVLSLDLFDDVQDDDLAGKSHAQAGPAIAINSAITLGFLALEALRRALELEPDPRRRLSYLRLFNRVSLEAAAGQHRDLRGAAGASTPEAVLAMHQAKTSSVVLLAECGALLGGCDAVTTRRYRAIGERLARFVQVRDDLRDVFGKRLSPDLASGKVSYPVACLLEGADAELRARFDRLVAALPGSMRALRALIYRGAAPRCAATLERLRRELHAEIAALAGEEPADAAAHRTLLDVVDALAQSVYRVSDVPETAPLFAPTGGFHDRVRAELGRFEARMARAGLPAPPTLRPWHQPHWMYVPAARTIFYPDIDGLGGEILPFHAALLGRTDLGDVARILEAQLPIVLAHEMFHFLRHARGRLTADHWHEEWVANRLAVAYARRFAPEALASIVDLGTLVIDRAGGLDARGAEVLGRCATPSGASGYDADIVSMAVITFEMVRRLVAEAPDLDEAVRALLEAPLRARSA